MSSSSSNLTTQWTFRDGRDYVLSLTTTEMPNTVSFWISDKITGEDWTGCYDENGIEVITKRTGCYKSFQTFLSMIKSAILKKSEAVIIELLNIEDLNAISLHRQQNAGKVSASSETSKPLSPLDFELYNNEVDSNMPPKCGSKSNKKSSATPGVDAGNSIAKSDEGSSANNNKISAQSLSTPLNKRKYLIVTYIAEFDKVHYPLPLNYSNPPDLNVMQKNILQLKAEVASLQSTKKELANELQAIKSGSMSPHSHDCGRTANSGKREMQANCLSSRKSANSFLAAATVSENSGDRLCNINLVDLKIPDSNGNDQGLFTSPCQRCSGLVGALQARIRDLENAIDFQKCEHAQSMEKLEHENNFLQHKVEAAEKYELELWNQIQKLKEKVAQADLDKEKQIKSVEACKDSRGCQSHSQSRQSRFDVFYSSSKKIPPIPKSLKPKSDASSNSKATFVRQRSSSQNSQRTSRANSAGSMGSLGSLGSGFGGASKPTDPPKVGKQTLWNFERRGGSISPFHPLNYVNRNNNNKARKQSSSPLRSPSKFNPTAYVTEKKQKQSAIANQRLQKIEARLRTNLRTRSGSRSVPCDLRLRV